MHIYNCNIIAVTYYSVIYLYTNTVYQKCVAVTNFIEIEATYFLADQYMAHFNYPLIKIISSCLP